MGCLRPATPGFIVTLVATGLLAVVSFCVPYFKSVYFLKANINVDGQSGAITFGTLGYCIELASGTTCSPPSIGYELDINALVGNRLPVQIPNVAVKWITYALFLHVVALAGAAGSAVFGLLAHVREMSMACCSTCISGFAAVVAMLAFIFDLVLFFVAKARINAVGTAEMGIAIWLTLAAWLLLFFSGCFFTLGRCCISNRPPKNKSSRWEPPTQNGNQNWGQKDPEAAPGPNPSEQLRLDAVKAEADRKARVKKQEQGLPPFHETQPLTAIVDGDNVYFDGDRTGSTAELTSGAAPPARQQGYAAGYVPGTPGNRTMDDYYNPTTPGPNTYPPQPQNQHNIQRQRSGYAPSAVSDAGGYGGGYAAGYGAYNRPSNASPPPANQMLTPQYDPYGRDYGHTQGGTSYHTASSHNQQPSGYDYSPSTYDPYNQSQQQPYPAQQQQPFNTDVYNATGRIGSPPMPTATPTAAVSNPYFGADSRTTSSPPPLPQPDRSYTLGGDGYGNNSVPPLQEGAGATPQGGFYGYGASAAGGGYGQHNYYTGHRQVDSPPPIETNLGGGGYTQQQQTSPVKGPRSQPGSQESPPGYEPSPTGVTGNWGKR